MKGQLNMFAAYVNDKCMKIGSREDVAAYLKKYYRLTVEELTELFANWEFSFTFDNMTIAFEIVPTVG